MIQRITFFFPPLSPHVKSCIFLNTLSPVLSTPLSYVCCVCMDRLMANFAGTCTSDNKGLLLLLLLLLKCLIHLGTGKKKKKSSRKAMTVLLEDAQL